MGMIETWQQALPHGITLSCRAAGARGRPVMMLLHGFPEGAFVWDALLEHFSKPEHGGYRCIAPNLRGFEHSSQPPDIEAYRAKHLVQDIAALAAIESPGQPLAALVAHDWGGAVAWNVASQLPQLLSKLVIINSPHPQTFLRELTSSPAQQASSAYMNFLIRPDAEQLLAEDDYRRLWDFFTNMGALDGQANGGHPWLSEAVKQQYRSVWDQGLTGGCNYYRASPLRPPSASDSAAAGVALPAEMFTVAVPTLVIWGMQDIALPPGLIEGLDRWVPQLVLHRIDEATHWIVHEQPERVINLIQNFL
jgi:epoxide hydrolase 4